jgi:hypothetical protein
MGPVRAGTETQPPSDQAAGSAAALSRWPARRWLEAAAWIVFAAALFAVNLTLSRTQPENSDQANILLAASDLLHGNLLLHGWYLTDVSFYTTELPQYAALEILFGVHANTAHIAASMTYTLAVLLAVLVARGGFSSRTAVTRLAIAAGIMLAPQLGIGVAALLLSVGHVGTSVPVLLIWLFLDRVRPHWYVPVLIALGLAWATIADQLVLVIGVVPLALVCLLRVGDGAVRERSLSRGLAARTFELSLMAAAAAGAGLAWVADRVLRALGGFTLNPIPFKFTLHHLPANLHSLWAVPQVFGADYRGLTGGPLAIALLHMAGLALVVLALILAGWRFFSGADLVDQLLAVAVVGNIALFVLTSAGAEGPHEIAVVAPFGAALAARMLARTRAPDGRTARPAVRQARMAGYAAGAAILLGYLGGLVHEVAQATAAPPDLATVASWLQAHDLRYGLGGYWESSIITVETGGQVKVRALAKASLAPDLWLAKPSWYDPASQQANFIVLSRTPGLLNWEPRALIETYFGRPARTYNFGPYTVLVWGRNLLPSVPR